MSSYKLSECAYTNKLKPLQYITERTRVHTFKFKCTRVYKNKLKTLLANNNFVLLLAFAFCTQPF